MAIQDDNTILNKGDLKAYHERIAPMLGGTFMVGTNNSDYYSTDEKVVGVWVDGRPIYQKVITVPWEDYTIISDCHKSLDMTSYHIKDPIDARVLFHTDVWWIDSSTRVTSDSGSTDVTTAVSIRFKADIIHIFKGSAITIDNTVLILQYTKTTDTAGSATTTPGAYDINFPNTWPANQEIFFGNGMYGYRATGNMAITANTVKSWDAVSITRTANTKIYNYGGTWKRSSAIPAAADTVFGIPLSDDPNINSGVIIGSQAIIFTVKDAFTGTVTYDFYVTYTK